MIATVLLGVCLTAAGPNARLGLAPKADPEDVTARGLLGLVRYRDEWAEPDAVAARVRADADEAAALDEYHARRDRTPDTSVAQMELADWCEHRGLKAEAIAHLTAVTRLEPNYFRPPGGALGPPPADPRALGVRGGVRGREGRGRGADEGGSLLGAPSRRAHQAARRARTGTRAGGARAGRRDRPPGRPGDLAGFR